MDTQLPTICIMATIIAETLGDKFDPASWNIVAVKLIIGKIPHSWFRNISGIAIKRAFLIGFVTEIFKIIYII